MMMKNLIKTLGFILAMAGPSVVMATSSPNHTITNHVCIESNQVPGVVRCDDVDVTLIDDTYACFSISGNHTTVPLNGKITFTCRASDNTKPHDFRIECGNEAVTVWTGHVGAGAGQSFSRVCEYGDRTTPYNVACYVDDEIPTNPACRTIIGYGFPDSDCGNGALEENEECDFSYLSYGKTGIIGDWLNNVEPRYPSSDEEKGKLCKNCKIINNGNFVYEPAECLYSDSPISVMNDEYLPYWWNLWIKNNTQSLTDDDDDCTQDYNDAHPDRTLLLKSSMKCHFAVYNGLHNQNGKPITGFVKDCYDDSALDENIFEYFKENHHARQASGAGLVKVNKNSIPYSDEEFGEYMLVLEKVDYKYCNNGEWKDGRRYGAICEVNFAITKPYIMQISTFGVNPVGSTDVNFLSGYYNLYGDNILNSTDLKNVIETDNNSYAVDYKVDDKFEEFKEKYGKLAVSIDINSAVKNGTYTSTWKNVFGNGVTSLKKVPNKSIYFLEGEGTLVLSQDNVDYLTTAFTLIVDGMDVEIQGDFLKYAMIVTNGSMSFRDGGSEKPYMSCADGGQVVQGIYVASNFEKSDENLKNDSVSKLWCPWGGLHVKGVLIGNNIDKLMESKRSQLNSWFNAPNSSESAIKKARRETIIKGASVLIEYSPSLWKTLPPGAEIFTESLEVYRR